MHYSGIPRALSMRYSKSFSGNSGQKITLLEHIEHAGLNLSVAIFCNRFLGYSEESSLLGKFIYNTDDINHEFHGT